MQQYEGAVSAFRRALAIDPNIGGAREHIQNTTEFVARTTDLTSPVGKVRRKANSLSVALREESARATTSDTAVTSLSSLGCPEANATIDVNATNSSNFRSFPGDD